MKGLCGIGVDPGSLRALLVYSHHNRVIPLTKIEIKISSQNFLDVLHTYIDTLEEEIRKREKKYSCAVEKIYCSLPFEWAKVKIVEDAIPLTTDKKKRLTLKDIRSAKNHIESVSLEWNEMCLHNIVLEYHLDNKIYTTLPLFLEGRKLTIKTQLIFIERKIFKEVENIFENIGRKFMGFVYKPLSDVSVNYQNAYQEVPCTTLNVGESYTLASGIRNHHLCIDRFDFSERKIKAALEERFLLSQDVCAEILNRYVTFCDTSFHKEVVIKDGTKYVNISMSSLNSFLQDFTARELGAVIEKLKDIYDKKIKIVFLGKIAFMKGFYSFLRHRFPSLEAEPVCFQSVAAPLLGCIKYGRRRYLEEVSLPKKSFFQQLLHMYREYF